MWLSSWGSLCDLARQRIRMQSGMRITLYDSGDADEDMEIDGVAKYDSSATDPRFNWYVEVQQDTFRRIPPLVATYDCTILSCFECGRELVGLTDVDASTCCPHCGSRVFDFLRLPGADPV